MTAPHSPRSDPLRHPFPPLWLAICLWAAGSLLAAQSVQSWLSSEALAGQFVSPATWAKLAARFSDQVVRLPSDQAQISFLRVLLFLGVVHAVTWLAGSVILAWRRGERWTISLRRWGVYGGVWWCLVGGWDWASLGLQMLGAEWLVSFWGLLPAFWCAMCLAGWGTAAITLSAKRQATAKSQATAAFNSSLSTLNPQPSTLCLWSLIILYVAIFVTMNWRLYFNLLIPHGDSAMYEEHLWNLLHGKGFRSYLDQGLFLGEHIQIVHLALLPIYALFPSHLTLEFCESLALALGAWPVFWMVCRHTGSPKAGLAAAAAYLLYPPMQFLDIEIDLKTFRPEAFGIPILLLTLDQLDRRHLWGTAIGMIGCLTVKEDYALVLAPLGAWIAITHLVSREATPSAAARRWVIFGVVTVIVSVLYLYLATRVIIPWFRSGAEVHYASYFSKFGESPEEIVRTMITQPGLLFGEFFRTSTVLYALMMLAPLAFVPVLSPGRLAVGLPLFGILCLNELARDPRHQFHAPLVAIIFWALAGALDRLPRFFPVRSPEAEKKYQEHVAWLHQMMQKGFIPRLAPMPELQAHPLPPSEFYRSSMSVPMIHIIWTSSLAMGLFFNLNPLSLTFWDPGSEWYWRKLYGPSRRAEEFAKIADLIPISAHVSSTDFVHPRYTHFERSYDYSGYRRKVSGYEAKVPDDTDYIVIDTQHPYSRAKSPSDIPEYRDHPDDWELLPDVTDGYFIVLKRRR